MHNIALKSKTFPVLVVGATGQDGTLLCRSLHQKGRLVIGTSRRIITDRYPWPILTLDYLNRTNVEVFLKEHSFSEIYFLGAQSSVGQSE